MKKRKGVIITAVLLLSSIIVLTAAATYIRKPIQYSKKDINIKTVYRTPEGLNMSMANTGQLNVDTENLEV
ncbi:MAG: hypothetical protein ABEI78_01450, partial [Candidatus Nanohaloarchaea archaeon]